MENKKPTLATRLLSYLSRTLSIGATLVLGVIGYGFVMFWFIFSMPYVQQCITAIYLAIYIPLLVYIIIQRNPKWFKGLLALALVVILASIGYLGYRAYLGSIPTMDDRYMQTSPYNPFREDTQAVTLPEESTLHLTFEEVSALRIDGATALYPVYASFARNVFEPSEEYYTWGEDRAYTLECDGTTWAYRDLICGDSDVIFCAAPSAQQLEDAAKAGVQLHLTPIGREAFVFFVNSKNPVSGLTVKDIQGIYTGDITNWKDVGGKNQKILAYQRDEGSGSQTALQMVMAGLPLMEPDTEEVIDGMGGIFTRVATYRNFGGALGFSFRFYANEMVGNNQIRLLSLNGVEPTKDTIRDGSYPISSYFYAVTASPIGEPAPEETNPTLRAFLDWCTGPQGQWIVEEVGYVSVDSAPDAFFDLSDYSWYITNHPSEQKTPPITTAAEAKAAAETVWRAKYGDLVLNEKPYIAARDVKNGVWFVTGTMPYDTPVPGGTACILLADDGDVLAVWHGQ